MKGCCFPYTIPESLLQTIQNRNQHPLVRMLSTECTHGNSGIKWFWKMLADPGLNLAQATRNCCVVAFEGKCWRFQGNFITDRRTHPLQCCDRCQCWDLLAWCPGVAQGHFFCRLCAGMAEAECLGMHLPFASVSWGQCSDSNRNSDWAKLVCTLAKAASCWVSYSGFCKRTVPGPWYIRNTICFCWKLPKLVILLHILRLHNLSSISFLSHV